MKSYTRDQLRRVLDHYNADHDMGPDAPVTWREERLARAILDLSESLEELEAKVSRLLDAVPSAQESR